MTDRAPVDFRDFKQVRQERRRRGRPFVIAHRGASASAPENTMAAFALAIRQGAHLIETDLWFAQDREIMLHHDRTLQRVMGRPEMVGQLSQRELSQCTTLASYPPEDGSTHIPALEELLELVRPARMALLLELKDPLFSQPGYGDILLEKLKEYDLLHSCFLVSFSPVCLEAMRALDPNMPLGLISMKMGLPREPWSLLGPIYPNFWVNPLYPWMAHRQETLVAPLDPHPQVRTDFYQKIGVDAILADDVAQMVALLEN